MWVWRKLKTTLIVSNFVAVGQLKQPDPGRRDLFFRHVLPVVHPKCWRWRLLPRPDCCYYLKFRNKENINEHGEPVQRQRKIWKRICSPSGELIWRDFSGRSNIHCKLKIDSDTLNISDLAFQIQFYLRREEITFAKWKANVKNWLRIFLNLYILYFSLTCLCKEGGS